MKRHIVILISLSFLYLSCNEYKDMGLNPERAGIGYKYQNESVNTENTENKYFIEGEVPVKAEFVGTIYQDCPGGITCDTSVGYHAYSGIIDSFSIYISFKSQWLNNKTHQGVKENFNFLYFSIYQPSRGNDSVVYYYHHLDPVWGHTVDSPWVYSCITGYSNDTLYGVIKVKYQYLIKIIHSRDSDCRMGDIGGVCGEMLDEPKEYIIQYKIRLEE